MFAPAGPNRVGPRNAPFLRLPNPGETFTQYLADLRANNRTTTATLGGLILSLSALAVANVNPLEVNCAAVFAPGAAAGILALAAAAPVAVPPSEDDENIAYALANILSCHGWLADLINAAHKKPLNESNVEGYFNSMSHSGSSASCIALFINKLAPFFPDSVMNAGFRATLHQSVWTDYRLARVSTGSIINSAMPAFIELGIIAPGGLVAAAVTAAHAAPWDVGLAAAIPETIKAYTMIYLEAAGTPIEKWYQGKKAMESLPSIRVRGAKEIFKRYLEIKNDVAGLAAMGNIANLVAGTGGFW